MSVFAITRPCYVQAQHVESRLQILTYQSELASRVDGWFALLPAAAEAKVDGAIVCR